MTAMFTSPAPSQSSQIARKYRTLNVVFGDGYRQDSPDGINYQIDSWTLNYENLNATDTTTVRAFFDSVGSFTPFTWTAPGDSTTKTWKLAPNGYQVTAQAGSIYSISANIYQVF